MKNKLVIVLLPMLLCINGCKPTYTFIANQCPSLITKGANTNVSINKLNKYNDNCLKDGWNIMEYTDTTSMDTLIMVSKYNNGEISGKVLILDEYYQVIQKYRVKNGKRKGISVTYYPAYENLWISITYANKKSTHLLRSRSIKGLHLKAKRKCQY